MIQDFWQYVLNACATIGPESEAGAIIQAFIWLRQIAGVGKWLLLKLFGFARWLCSWRIRASRLERGMIVLICRV